MRRSAGIQARELLERALAEPPDSPVWGEVLQLFGLERCYWAELWEVIRKGKWREVRNPIAWIRSVAMREAVKLNTWPEVLVSSLRFREGPEDEPQDHDSQLEYLASKALEKYDQVDDRTYIDRVDGELLTEENLLRVDWSEVGRRAGVPEHAWCLLWLRALGLTRTGALTSAPTDEMRRQRTAAWRAQERSYPALREVLTYGRRLPSSVLKKNSVAQMSPIGPEPGTT